MDSCRSQDCDAAAQAAAVLAPFVTKMYQLVDDPATDHIVSWGGDGISSFVVWRQPEFARDILPKYFAHSNFDSFVSQLCTYGFRYRKRKAVPPERWEFTNELFRKGQKHLLCQIHSRKTSTKTPTAASPPLHLVARDGDVGGLAIPHPRRSEPQHAAATRARPPLSLAPLPAAAAATVLMMEENARLRRSNTALLQELARMRKLYINAVWLVQNNCAPWRPATATAASQPQGLVGVHAARKMPAARLKHSGWNTTSSSSIVTIAEDPSH